MFNLLEVPVGNRLIHGLVTPGAIDTPIAIHLHGTGGNFYSNRIATAFAELYMRFGYRFATVNLPGFDSEYRTENITDYGPALDAWLTRISTGEYLLQGHSLGALKTIDHVLSRDVNDRCKRIALLSPFDIVAFYCNGELDQINTIRQRILKMQSEFGGDVSVPKDIFNVWDISASTYLSMIEAGGIADCFPSRDFSKMSLGKWLPKQNVFIAIGGADFAAYPNPKEVYEMLPKAKNLTAAIIDGAPHNFDGKIELLSFALQEWLAKS